MEKVQLKPRNIIGIAIKTTNENQQSEKDIAQLWKRFWQENIASGISNKMNEDIYCVYTEYEGDFTKPYTTIIGYEVSNLDEIPEMMKGITIEGGNYMQLTVKGNPEEGIVVQGWSQIWQSNLQRTYQADFEVYSARTDNQDNMEIDIFVSVE